MKNKIKSIFIIIIFSYLQIYKSNECNQSTPILKEENCQLVYCSDEEFNLGKCIINNTIIKTQWLNNILNVGELNFRYLNFIKTANNITFFETSAHPDYTYERIYFGIKEDGSAFFGNSSGNKSYIIKKKIPNNKEKYESEAGFIKINSDDNNYKDKEYIITIGKSSTYTEIFNINNLDEDLQLIPTNTLIGDNTETYISSTINLTEEGIHYFFFAAIKGNSNYLFSLNKFKFQINSGSNVVFYTKIGSIDYTTTKERRMVTCFITENRIIVCFYYSKTNSKLAIALINPDLTKLKDNEDYLESANDGSYFYKCIHFKNEIGIFVYFLGSGEESIKIKILEISNDYSLNNYIENFVDSLSAIKSSNYFSYNDIIKLTDYQICYVSCNNDKDTLIVEMINFYGEKNYNIRYYVIPIFKLYNIKILWEIKLQRYNQHAAFAFSFCKQESCDGDDNPHYSSLLIFSYPNINDTIINLNEFFFEKNKKYLSIDFTENANIDNNIFGLVIDGIKIKDICYNQMQLISTKYSKEIYNDDILDKDDLIKIQSPNNEYNVMNCEIKYQLIITEPEIREYNKYPKYIYKGNNSNEDTDFVRNKYEGKIGSYNIIIDTALSGNCNSSFCYLCIKNDTNYCIVCKGNYTFETDENYPNFKKCEETEIEEETEEEKEEEVIENKDDKEDTENTEDSEDIENIGDLEDCSIEMIIENKCKSKSLSPEEYLKIYQNLKKNLASLKDENIIIETKNVTFHVSSYNEQKLDNIKKISNIDIGKCENELKEKYNIKSDLIVIKTDIISDDFTQTYVQYEIFNPNDLQELNLSECSDITINTPIYFDKEVETLYNSLNESGYNIFNQNDSFYNDICTPYKTTENTDIILNDRKKIYLKYSNISLCQNNCEFIYYSSHTKKASCKCNSQESIINSKKIDFSEIFKREPIYDSFLKTIKNSNFLVLKCYEYAINLKTIITNIGRINMSLILILFVVIMVINFTVGKDYLYNIIMAIVNKKCELYKSNKKKKNKIKRNKNKKISSKINKNNNSKKNKDKDKNKIRLNNPPKTKKEKNKDKILNSIQHLKPKNKMSFSNGELTLKNLEKDLSSKKISYLGEIKDNILKSDKKKKIIETYNDQELNSMIYKDALKYDKRTYIQYYFSLLKRKQLILFTFWPNNDYNLIFIKIDLFLISFSLYFTINGFFFDDKTMNKIYVNNGNYSIFLQITQILLSSIISVLINLILKLLALSENDILNLKKISEFNEVKKKSKTVIKYLKSKFIIFFALSTLLLCFFWYFIACFCGVFVNTQIFLIKYTYTSFAISMIYPFGLNLIPGIFRIVALRDKNSNKDILYKISKIIALI